MRTAALLAACALAQSALGQIRADSSAGTIVTRPGGNFSITGGTLAGQNLFHSFSSFNVPTSTTATFSGPASVHNIIGRVTGGNASSIDGTLRSSISGANLFLVNPSGVALGPNARLDVSGSVHIATADYLALGGGARFDAKLPSSASSFSSAPPQAFGFLGASAAPLAITSSQLTVLNGAGLSLAGGDITISEATINALGGRVALTGLGDVTLTNARVNLSSTAGLASGSMTVQGRSLAMSATGIRSLNSSTQAGGSFSARVDSNLDLAGSFFEFGTFSTGAAGNVALEGARISVTDNSSISTGTFGAGRAGGISVTAGDSILLTGAFTRLSSGTQGTLSGDAGSIGLRAGGALAVDQATVDASTNGAGRAGAITIDAARLSIVNQGIVESSTNGSGDAGTVAIRASESIDITGTDNQAHRGGIYSTTIGFLASGNAGAIRVEAPVLRMHLGEIQSTSEQGGGNAGTIVIRAGRLEMTAGARISTTTFSSGRGGFLDVQAGVSIDMSGTAASGEGTALRSNSQGTGEAGVISVQTGNLTVRDYATISSEARGTGAAGAITIRAARINVLGAGSITTSTLGPRDAGTLSVEATDSIRISGRGTRPLDFSAIASNSQEGATGNAGTITVAAPTILIDDGGAIQSVAEAGGRGGNINVQAARLTLAGGGQISSTTFSSGDSGSISVRASESMYVSGDVPLFGSGIFTGAQGTGITGDAGPIFIQTPSLVMRNVGGVSSNTSGTGKAGNISLQVGDLSLEGGSYVSASTTGTGSGGTLSVTASGTIRTDGTDVDGNSSAFFTRTDGPGDAGRILLSARDMLITGFSGVSSESAGRGNAGSISLDISGRLQVSGGQISTQSARSSGGGIRIRVGDLVYVSDGGAIITEVAQGRGDGGDIFIDPEFVVLNRGFIVANAIDGNGGNITIVANNFLNQDGTITATSRTGISGNIEIRSPVVDANGALVQLSGSFLDASRLIRETCAARAGREGSRFVAAPRGGLAAAPQNEGAPRGAPSTSSSSQVRSSCAG